VHKKSSGGVIQQNGQLSNMLPWFRAVVLLKRRAISETVVAVGSTLFLAAYNNTFLTCKKASFMEGATGGHDKIDETNMI
jgi:hypothetical protein